MVILVALAAFASTLIGGILAIKLKDKLHLVIGFSAGAVIGVALFDLIPEAIELGSAFFDESTVLSFTALGFLGFLVLDRLVLLHDHDHGHKKSSNGEEVEDNDQEFLHYRRGALGAGSISLHSLIDGISIGLAFQVSTTIGIVVALAVLIHNFSDGINTVTMILKDGGNAKLAFKWLIADAIAPMLGAGLTLFFTLSQSALTVILALFSGTFLYIGASDLIPESHHSHSKFMTTAMTIIGAGLIYLAIRAIH